MGILGRVLYVQEKDSLPVKTNVQRKRESWKREPATYTCRPLHLYHRTCPNQSQHDAGEEQKYLEEKKKTGHTEGKIGSE